MAQYSKSLLEAQLKRGEELTKMWPWRLLLFTIIIFCTILAIYLGILLGYGPYLDAQASSLDKEITDLDRELQSDEAKALIRFYSQLVDTAALLKNHHMPSHLIDFLANNTDSGIQYTNFSFSDTDSIIQLDGIALGYNVLVRQLAIFENNPKVVDSSLSNASAGSDARGVTFSIRLTMAPDIVRP